MFNHWALNNVAAVRGALSVGAIRALGQCVSRRSVAGTSLIFWLEWPSVCRASDAHVRVPNYVLLANSYCSRIILEQEYESAWPEIQGDYGQIKARKLHTIFISGCFVISLLFKLFWRFRWESSPSLSLSLSLYRQEDSLSTQWLESLCVSVLVDFKGAALLRFSKLESSLPVSH